MSFDRSHSPAWPLLSQNTKHFHHLKKLPHISAPLPGKHWSAFHHYGLVFLVLKFHKIESYNKHSFLSSFNKHNIFVIISGGGSFRGDQEEVGSRAQEAGIACVGRRASRQDCVAQFRDSIHNVWYAQRQEWVDDRGGHSRWPLRSDTSKVWPCPCAWLIVGLL